MCTNLITPRRVLTLAGTTTTAVSAWEGQWQLLGGGAGSLRTALELLQLTGTMTALVRYRTAAVRVDKPGAWSALTGVSAAGTTAVDTVALGSSSDMWLQLSVAASCGSPVGGGVAAVSATLDSDAKLVGRRSLQIGEASGIVPITAPIPAVGLSGFMLAVVSSGVFGSAGSGNALVLQPVIRAITADPSAPGVWSNLGTVRTLTVPDDVDEWNQGKISYTPSTGALLVQLGLKWTSTTTTAQVALAASAVY